MLVRYPVSSGGLVGARWLLPSDAGSVAPGALGSVGWWWPVDVLSMPCGSEIWQQSFWGVGANDERYPLVS